MWGVRKQGRVGEGMGRGCITLPLHSAEFRDAREERSNSYACVSTHCIQGG